MPCSSELYPGEMAANDARIARQRADEATVAACEMADVLRVHGLFARLSAPTRAWIEKHEEADRRRADSEAKQRAERKRREGLRRGALGKLTAEEKKALGLQGAFK